MFIKDEKQIEECQRILGIKSVNSIKEKVNDENSPTLVSNPQNKLPDDIVVKKSYNGSGSYNGNNEKKPILEPNPRDEIPDEIIGKEFNNKRYKAIDRLGSGSFSTVYLVLDRNDRNVNEKAMKILEYTLEAENELDLIQATTTHENIVRYFHHFDIKKGPTYHLCLITEYCQVCIS